MSIEHIVALAVFTLSITLLPGPNNAVLMASGLTHGFVRTAPAILGLGTAFLLMIVGVTLGLAALFEMFPLLDTALKVAGLIYILYMAWRMASATPRAGREAARPLSFLEGMGVMGLNPQGWVFITSYVTAFMVRDAFVSSFIALVVVCTSARLVGACFWAMSGFWLRRVLASERAVRALNLSMALLMVTSLWPIVRDLARSWG